MLAASPAPAQRLDGGGTPEAEIAVAVATLWIAPAQARPIDAPSLANPVDMGRWVASMSVAEKQWLVGRLATQALYGDPVVVLETRGDWTKVAVPSQPSSLDARGYPGWLPTGQVALHPSVTAATAANVARVTARSTVLHDAAAPARALITVSYNTRLPVLASAPTVTTVATASGGRALVATADIAAVAPGAPAPTGADLVASAQLFSGLDYLWAGTSGYGFDCSGFTETVYAAHGITIPRDADDQARAGTPVAEGQLQPGDLLFYASDHGRGLIHHVAMYVGGGRMIQSPATGRTVETVPVATSGFPGEFWGARRYLTTSQG
jgi:cell wall-associated NlpC family hydrolase